MPSISLSARKLSNREGTEWDEFRWNWTLTSRQMTSVSEYIARYHKGEIGLLTTIELINKYVDETRSMEEDRRERSATKGSFNL